MRHRCRHLRSSFECGRSVAAGVPGPAEIEGPSLAGVVRPLAVVDVDGNDASMGGGDADVTARVITSAPLLRRGLERAAAAAGLSVVPPAGAATVTLRSAAATAVFGGGIDITVERDHVVVTIWRTVDEATALALQRLVRELLDP